MTTAQESGKSRQSPAKRSGGRKCRKGNGTQGTGRASPAELTRLIGDPLSGPDRQMEKGSSFGGLLNRLWPRNVARPTDLVGPMHGKPEHRRLEGPGRDVTLTERHAVEG